MTSPSAPSIAPPAEPTALACELHPTRLGPPAVPWAADAPLLGRGRRSNRARSNYATTRPNIATNGHGKPNYRPHYRSHSVPSGAPLPISASAAATAAAIRAWAGVDTECHALSREFAHVLESANLAREAYVICSVDGLSFHEAHAALNLNPVGSPLRCQSAIKGPYSALWRIAEGKEISKLIDTGTMRPIFAADQPADRRKDTTYYNPQVKEKPEPEVQ